MSKISESGRYWDLTSDLFRVSYKHGVHCCSPLSENPVTSSFCLPCTPANGGGIEIGVGSFFGDDYFTRTAQSYNLPAQKGASGSAVVNLAGELVGQIASGGRPYQAEKTRVLPQKYGLFATELWTDVLDTTPAPYSTYSSIPVSAQVSDGAPSNYIREMINIGAPGELP